ncbi:MAG: zinc dependent phospholipase C family protein [Anaerolineae bacterium]|nr:zinc dependent phospholipase C family protein [Anaerolineae bacterium]
MATLIAHLVIGERVAATLGHLRSSPTVYAAFLLGCVLVDANRYADLERHQTHLVKLSNGEGGGATTGSCATFLKRRDSLLLRRWSTLTEPEQAFVAGYLCHLAADEAWLEVSRGLLEELGLETWKDLPVPAEVMVVTFNALSQDLLDDFSAVASALEGAVIPGILRHVSQHTFQRMWDVARGYVLAGGGLDSYLGLLEAQGRPDTDVETVRQQVDRYGGEATALVQAAGGMERFIQPAVERAVHVIPQLWHERSSNRRG